ncbi:hypothetical protein IFM89_022869 [Coptis chinensis]|uniref:Histidinol dehydrogenase n=1 Tax=Coptis chinensis TaxID=261450 RepID=A0A835HLX9_9MAGN|nr:hypothetical protein IFM89_022869 [Coptis chinensis]
MADAPRVHRKPSNYFPFETFVDSASELTPKREAEKAVHTGADLESAIDTCLGYFTMDPTVIEESPMREYSEESRVNHVIETAEDSKVNPVMERAEDLKSKLENGFPSFVKPMTQSYLKGGTWLVEKIFGPGNQYVTTTKMILQNSEAMVSIDMPAGPSEVLVIADKYANPVHIAADLLSQAKHGPDSQVVLVIYGDGSTEFPLMNTQQEAGSRGWRIPSRSDVS